MTVTMAMTGLLAGCACSPHEADAAAAAAGSKTGAGQGAATASARPSLAELTQQVRAAEQAFAQTMAERNHAKFSDFIAEDAIFFTTDVPYRGKQQVVAGWQRFFQVPYAPFSWKPERVEVQDSGQLALSTGPVFDPNGKLIAHFTSIWRHEAPGVWRVIFDKGEAAVPAEKR